LIKSVADFLEQLRQAENQVLKEQDIKHAPTIGDMYEGLTQEILSKAMPSDVDISAGFLTDDSGQLSDELDCLVVCGEGEVVPYTTKRKYHIDDVVAVVQVKKNLFAKDLKSGYENLASVNALRPARDKGGLLFIHAYRTTTLTNPPLADEWRDKLSYEMQMIYYVLAMDVYYPARIILGYNGFATQSSLRSAFYKYVEAQLEAGCASGFGVHNLPSMVCCGGHSLVKTNGMPYCSSVNSEGYWPVLRSTSVGPVELMLEIIWTRLVYMGKLSGQVFDDDSSLTPMLPFLYARPHKGGWEYRMPDLPKEVVDSVLAYAEWSPAFLDDTQFAVVAKLSKNISIDLGDSEFIEFLLGAGYTVNALVESLKEMRIANADGGKLTLITSQCECILLPDGRVAAADNRAGELTRWYVREFGHKSDTVDASET
jgi:hypothetical protein